jgi:hypothetical protein
MTIIEIGGCGGNIYLTLCLSFRRRSFTTERAELQQKVGQCLFSDGRYNEAEALFFRILENNEKTRGQDHPSTLTSNSQTGVQVMETRDKKDSTGTRTSRHPGQHMGNLASTYRNRGRWAEVERLEVH